MTPLIDRAIAYLSPGWGLRRQRARVAADLVKRAAYDAASTGRRTAGWRMSAGDANAAVGWDLKRLREAARDLVRNNAHAASAISTIADHTVGWGIVAKPKRRLPRAAEDAWEVWAETTACDADGREDLYGLQKLVVRTVVESGECLVRRRLRTRPEDLDSLSIPMQLQVLEPDYLDTTKTGETTAGGGRIVHGIEFDVIGRRRGYWLFPEHPGSQTFGGSSASRFVPADGVLHVFRRDRPQQVRGASWFAPVTMKLADFADYDDAQLMKQKIAACLAVITTDVNGNASPLGSTTSAQPTWDYLEPGIVLNAPPGQDVTVVSPPRVEGFGEYAEVTLRAIATGLGVTYEDLTGDYTDLPFSAARMSRLRHWSRVNDWRWRLIIPQFCDPVWYWALQLMRVGGSLSVGEAMLPRAEWTAPPMPMIDPDKEGLAYMRNIRSGLMSHSEALRERGYDPEDTLKELSGDYKRLDQLELVLDIDARKMTQAGQAQAQPKDEAAESPKAPEKGAAPDGGQAMPDDDEDEERRIARFVEDAIERNADLILARAIARAAPDVATVPSQPNEELTEKQRAVYRALREYRQANGEAPRRSLLARRLGVDPKTIQYHLNALHRKGLLKAPSPEGLPD